MSPPHLISVFVLQNSETTHTHTHLDALAMNRTAPALELSPHSSRAPKRFLYFQTDVLSSKALFHFPERCASE